jgi:hypothetical protein
MRAFKIAFVVLVISGLIAEFFCETFSTVINYWTVDLDGTTTGVVTKSEKTLSNGGRISVLTYDIEYEYRVDGSRYRSSRVVHGRSDENPYKILDRYPSGKEVIVYYDSARPEFSLLELSGLSAKTYGQLGALIFLFLLVFFWIMREGNN